MSVVKYIDRRNTNCVKWDAQNNSFQEEGLLPFWVADMDFQVAECITDALSDYVKKGVFGYFDVPDSYTQSIQDWEKCYHNSDVKKDWIRFSPGVVSGFHWIVQYLTQPGDNILVMTPVYYPFFHAANNNDRTLISAPLTNTNGYYEMNFDDIEKKITENSISLLIFCSPHNPVGRVWKKEELEQLFTLCRKYNVQIIADEIHQDLTYEDHKHISALTFPEYYDLLHVLTAPSKTFNLAACQNSVIIIPDENHRKKWDAYTAKLSITSGNAFGYIAAEAAYSKGHEWYAEVKEVIYNNYCYVKETLTKEFPDLVISPLEGTYLMWIDFHAYLKQEEMHDFIQGKCKMAFDYGDWFGGDSYGTFIRMNLATSLDNVKEAVCRIIENL